MHVGGAPGGIVGGSAAHGESHPEMDRGTGTAAVRLIQQQRDVERDVWELGVYTRGLENY